MVKNVARKSTSNRPLKIVSNIVEISNGFLTRSKISKLTTSYNNQVQNVKKTNWDTYKYNTCSNLTPVDNLSSDSKKYQSISDCSEDVSDNIGGVFCISNPMMKYLRESLKTPPLDETDAFCSDDEAVNLNQVLNYPVLCGFPGVGMKKIVHCTTNVKISNTAKIKADNPKRDLATSSTISLIENVNGFEKGIPATKIESHINRTKSSKKFVFIADEFVKKIESRAKISVSKNKITQNETCSNECNPILEEMCKIEFVTSISAKTFWDMNVHS